MSAGFFILVGHYCLAIASELTVKYYRWRQFRQNRSMNCFLRIALAGVFLLLLNNVGLSQGWTTLERDTPLQLSLRPKDTAGLSMNLTAGEVLDLRIKGSEAMFLELDLSDPSGKQLVKGSDALRGILMIPEITGRYELVVRNTDTQPENLSTATAFTISYSNKLNLPKNAKTTATRVINGYTARTIDEVGDDASTYLTIQKAGKIVGVMRAEKEMTGGFYFSDDPTKFTPKASVALIRSTPDKTGDGTPDIAVEYYSGGAHCCFDITFFELGSRVRQLPTISTDNDQLTAFAKKPGGGLRFRFSEQAFAYWAIAFAYSPMPTVIYEFDKSDEFIPRFDLMKKPAPSPAKLKQTAAATRAKLNLHPYTSPDDNFNDFEEPFWGEMLDLIYTGHEDLAWQYFAMVWPAKKPGKEKFLADFKEQLALTAYGEWKKGQNR
jgi:hypothetical protein